MPKISIPTVCEQVRNLLLDPLFPQTAQEINNGWCADFAQLVWEQSGGIVNIYNDEELGAGDYTHTFIQHGNLYYDAECIEGVDDWTQLPVFHRRVSCPKK